MLKLTAVYQIKGALFVCIIFITTKINILRCCVLEAEKQSRLCTQYAFARVA